MRDEIMNRDEKLKGTDAVKSGRVYVSAIEHFCWPAAVGFEANWFYPDDIKVSREKWLKKLYGAEYKGGFDKLLVYPCS
jgi:hypothetical protein